MNTAVNAALNTVGTGLVAAGAVSLSTGFNWGGVIEVVLGLAVYVVYELTPSTPKPTV